MRTLKSGALVALVLVSALVVIGSPAFATPNITASSGTRAVSPFITPIGSTRSQSTAQAGSTSLSIAALGASVTCDRAVTSAYVDTTHTQLKITSLSFGTGRVGSCVTTPAGSIDGNQITCTATSTNPWFLHVRSVAGNSSTGTVNITSTCRFVATTSALGSLTFTVDANQSCIAGPGAGVRYTSATRVLDVTCTLTVTVRPLGSFTANFSGVFNVRPDTRRDAALTVTLAS